MCRINEKTNEQFLKELNELLSNIEPLEEYQSANKKICVRCKECEHTWFVRPHDLLGSKGCPN